MYKTELVLTEPEIYTSNVTRQWVVGYPIVIIKISDVTRSSVDQWFEICKRTMEENEGDHVFALHDLTTKAMGFTPYSQAKSTELLRLYPELKVYTALLLQKTVIAQFIKHFLRFYSPGHHTVMIFFDREEALDWLFTKMQDVVSSAPS